MDTNVKKGQTVILSSGAYESYRLDGLFVALKDFSLPDIFEVWKKEELVVDNCGDVVEPVLGDFTSFKKWAMENDYIEPFSPVLEFRYLNDLDTGEGVDYVDKTLVSE